MSEIETFTSTKSEDSTLFCKECTQERKRSLAGDALEEIIDDLQCGDFTVIGHFDPTRLAEFYLGGADERSKNLSTIKMEELAEKLVDRILISSAENPQGQELQLKLVNNVLHGAEVWIKRDKGDLILDIKTRTRESHAFFNEKLNNLTSHLEDHIDEKVKVVVSVSGSNL